MIKLLTATQLRNADDYTIRHKPIASIDLMEAAANAFVGIFTKWFPDPGSSISIYCGTGNNGGDGLAIARILKSKGYDELSVKIIRYSSSSSADFRENLSRLSLSGIPIYEINENDPLPDEKTSICIDAILGSGLNRPLKGKLKKLISQLNRPGAKTVSVDVPTGMPADSTFAPGAVMINAFLTISFQNPKLSFFFPEHGHACGHIEVADIGLDQGFISRQSSYWFLYRIEDAATMLKKRAEFSHKGIYGHTLVIAGSKKSMGAALLASGASVYTGSGLTTALIPATGHVAMNSLYPEVQFLEQDKFTFKDDIPYHSMVFGPGIGTGKKAKDLLKYIMTHTSGGLVLDADGLNILAGSKTWLQKLPPGTILTPHVKEFDRLFGKHTTWMERIETARLKAAEHQIIIVMKNRYSFVVRPDKKVFVNSSGNPAMAIGGSGDVLAGMIGSLLAQKYNPDDATSLGCFLHGHTADRLQRSGMYVVPPSVLIREIPYAMNELLDGDLTHHH